MNVDAEFRRGENDDGLVRAWSGKSIGISRSEISKMSRSVAMIVGAHR
jgi:hypothetical protein